MRDSLRHLRLPAVLVVGAWLGLAGQAVPAQSAVTGFTGARVITADGPRAFEAQEITVIVQGGRVERLEPTRARPPAGATVVDLEGKFIVAGLISAHAHVSDVNGLRPRAYTDENTRRQLDVYARYGITAVFSLGGEQAPAFAVRDDQETAATVRARIFLSGDVINAATADAARQAVARVAALKPDIIKIRVDDNLGTATKMPPEAYRAVIDEAHRRGLRVAAHIFYLEDAKALLRAGVDMIAHSVRDRDVDEEFLSLMKARNVPYCPTLTREVSAFAYESTPAFFADPFFLREADRDVVAQLQQPARQQAMAASAPAQRYKAGLVVALRNLKAVADRGVPVAMGTDSGAFADRFQGYFEHLEMAMMAEAGLTPAQILRSATTDAARAIGRDDIGALAPGRWADFVVLDENPLTGVAKTKSIAQVWIGGRQVAR
jgi:imidazolonepropionase-like amidohydrolase